MGGISIWQLFIVLFFLGTFLIPLLLTGFSKRAKGAGKVGWLILVFFTSWIGYAVFLIVTQLVKPTGQQQI
tara:strand:- start:87 stop:299 length:213 start_codon:yes stop_codon:yes gene_type:complete